MLVVILPAFVITTGGCAALERKPEHSHDVAITNMSAPSKCAQGDTVPVVVSMANQGNHNESFNITLTDVTDGKEIGTQLISLPCKASLMDVTCDLTFTGANVGDTAYTTNTGDIDGDNYADLLVGAMNYNSSQGRAYLYYGGPNMDNQTDLIFDGEVGQTSHFGWLQGVGDVDNDNYDDIVVTAGPYNNGQGRLYLYWGGPRGSMDNQADLTFNGEPGSYLGSGWDDLIVEDIDGDSYDDIVGCSRYYDNYQGRAYLYWGDTKGSMNADCDLTFDGEAADNNFGVGTDCGYIDEDGYKDIVIGAPDYNSGAGRSYLYWGSSKASMDANADLIFDPPAAGGFGVNIGIADIDNDSYEDVVIGAWKYGNNQGRAYLYWGNRKSSFDTTPDLIFTGEQDNNYFAELCTTGGDVNNDGHADILIGAKGYDNRRGRAYLYLGDTKAKMDANADYIFTGENQGDWLGDPPGGNFGDFDNDGYDDLAIGARYYLSGDQTGRVYLYYGGPSSYSTEVSFDWDTIRTSTGEHTLKAEIVPVAGEEDTKDNTMTATVNIESKVN